MKYFYFLIAVLTLASFKTIHQQYKDNDRTLFDLIKKIEQDPGNKSVTRSISETYENLKQTHLQNIFELKDNADLASHETTLDEYKALQQMFEAIEKSPVARQVITATDHSVVIAQLAEQLAAEYYKQGLEYRALSGRKNKTKAYNALKNANELVPNYKDSESKMTKAWEESHIDIQINPLKYNIATEELDINHDQTISNEMPLQLAGYLEEKYSSRYNAKFITAPSTEKISADWIINLSFTDLKITGPSTVYSSNTPNFRSDIKDNTGATVVDPQRTPENAGLPGLKDENTVSVSSSGKMKVTIIDRKTGKTISTSLLNNSHKWTHTTANSTVTDRNYAVPDKESVLNELYQKFIPDIASVIANALQK